mmetsp:Transcript_58033/g.152430  ORF Transcript_58033/g.152430 Transcript_58033/m.152430 type:complete len:477 (-) Transcript_58033:575-2005(-)
MRMEGPSACPRSSCTAASTRDGAKLMPFALSPSLGGHGAPATPAAPLAVFFRGDFATSASTVGSTAAGVAAPASGSSAPATAASSAVDAGPAPAAALDAFFCFFLALLLCTWGSAASPPVESPTAAALLGAALSAGAGLPSLAPFLTVDGSGSAPFLAFLPFLPLPLPPSASSSASSSSSSPIRSFSTSASSSCRTASSTAKSRGSRPSWQRMRTCAPCSSKQRTPSQQPLHAATHSTVLPSSSTAFTSVPSWSSNCIDSACPSRAALRRAISPCCPRGSAPACSKVLSTLARCCFSPAAWARPVLARRARCCVSIWTMADGPCASNRATVAASPRAEKARSSGCACSALHLPFHIRSSSVITSSLLESHASARARPTSCRSRFSLSQWLQSRSIATTAAHEWPAATLSTLLASLVAGPMYCSISATTRSMIATLPFFWMTLSRSSNACCADVIPVCRSRLSSSWRPLSAMDMSAL